MIDIDIFTEMYTLWFSYTVIVLRRYVIFYASWDLLSST